MQRPLTEVEFELAKTKRELAEVKMERDMLKKAAAYCQTFDHARNVYIHPKSNSQIPRYAPNPRYAPLAPISASVRQLHFAIPVSVRAE
jgi:hypothetical protein